MALKRLKTKKSKRVPARQKYQILKKIREHKRKTRREAKKQPRGKSQKHKLIQVPNVCPFKQQILEEAASVKQRITEVDIRQKELIRTTALESNKERPKDLIALLEDAQTRGEVHEIHAKSNGFEVQNENTKNIVDNSLRAYFKEFNKVIENADVVLEVVDARDPLGTRCAEVEKLVRAAAGNKRLVLVLNKSDLVPRDNLRKWITYFRKKLPVTPFKASTQNQAQTLGRRKFHQINSEKSMQNAVCIGADLLMSMLANYCRNKNIKTSIKVGVVGIPNVGKSSVINSLKRQRSCNVGCTPGVTKIMQEVELDAKIKLLDCPGVVFPSTTGTSLVLKNAQKVSNVTDPSLLAEHILKRASKHYFCRLYDVTEFDSYMEFFVKLAKRMGKFLKGGVPNAEAAARIILNDWNSGKIKYCTQPPEEINTSDTHISAVILDCHVKEFDIDNFEPHFETFGTTDKDVIEMQSSMLVDQEITSEATIIIENDDATQFSKESKKLKLAAVPPSTGKHVKKNDDSRLISEGNQALNKKMKQLQKKGKKINKRDEDKVSNVINILDGFNLQNAPADAKYDFDEDFQI